MKKFLITIDEEQFFIEAPTELEASMKVIADKFPTLLDDELADAFDIMEITKDRELSHLENMLQEGLFAY